MEYFDKRGQLRSSQLMAEGVHRNARSTPRGEGPVNTLRGLCQQRGLDKEELSVKEMINEDPMKWLWEGNVKRSGWGSVVQASQEGGKAARK